MSWLNRCKDSKVDASRWPKLSLARAVATTHKNEQERTFQANAVNMLTQAAEKMLAVLENKSSTEEEILFAFDELNVATKAAKNWTK